MNRVFLLLGSNIGDKRKVLSQTMQLISFRIGKIFAQSAIYETEPWGNKNQPSFYNLVIQVKTMLEPNDLLDVCKKTEKEAGREESEKWGPRVIDIDILFYEDKIYESSKLTIPHPQMHLRKFTLEPLCEIAPDFVHPVFGKNIATLLSECNDENAVKKLADNES